jgi:thioredoxin reductase
MTSELDGKVWRVSGATWNDRAANVILALGRRGAPKQLGVPGEELEKVSYRLLEPEPFAGKHVMVVGGGNAAADCAIALAEAGLCASVGLSYRRTDLPRLRSSVRTAIDRHFADGSIKALLGTEVVSIAEREVMLRTNGQLAPVANDAVIVQIGGQPPSDLLRSVGIELVEKRGDA